jgi:phosphopantothenoylcysteine decarboxylase/phosphopantothenate--cysteine ligase
MIPLRLPVFAHKRVHLGVTGSVAAYKGLDLLRLFVKTGMTAGATLTHAASRFVTDLSFVSLGADPVYGPLFHDQLSPYGHLEPGQVAQAMVIAPATASMMAKVAHGLADDMLSTQALAFDGPLIIAPCMNPRTRPQEPIGKPFCPGESSGFRPLRGTLPAAIRAGDDWPKPKISIWQP